MDGGRKVRSRITDTSQLSNLDVGRRVTSREVDGKSGDYAQVDETCPKELGSNSSGRRRAGRLGLNGGFQPLWINQFRRCEALDGCSDVCVRASGTGQEGEGRFFAGSVCSRKPRLLVTL